MKVVPLDRSACLRRLGSDETADAAAIRRAYRRLALMHHPDRNGGSKEAHRRFIDIGEAYRELMRQEAERIKALRRPRTVTPAEMAISQGWKSAAAAPSAATDPPPAPATKTRDRSRIVKTPAVCLIWVLLLYAIPTAVNHALHSLLAEPPRVSTLKDRSIDLGNGVTLELVRIPAGSFRHGLQ